MEIRVRESTENQLEKNEKKVVVQIINGHSNTECQNLTFHDILGSNAEIFHSGNSKEGNFLNYGNSNNMIMTIKLPIVGPKIYKIKVLLQSDYKTSEEVVSHTVNSNGEISTSSLLQETIKTSYANSGILVLEYNTDLDSLLI